VQAGDNVSIVEDPDTITISASTGSDGGTGGSGDFVKLIHMDVTAASDYINCNSIFNASLYDSYVVYGSKVIPVSNDVRFSMQFKTGTQIIYGDTDYTTFRSGADSSTYESEQVANKAMYLPMYGIVSQSVASDTTGISGQLFIVVMNSTTFKAQLVGSATGYSVIGDPVTLYNFTTVLNLAYSVDGFRLLFSSGQIASGSTTVFGVKK